ncbi:10137_t:CDS:2, partial [Ambispora leptoticha]
CCVAEFDVVVSPKRTKGFKWTVNIEHATLEALKDSIRAVYQTPALENDGAVFNVTPSKAFNNWTFPKVCQLYNLSEDPNPDVSVFPTFSCGCSDTKNVNFQVALDKLMVELQTRLATTPINLSYEATKTIYTYSYLASAVSLFETLIRIRPEKLIEGKNGQGKTDYAMESCATGRIIGVVEVKREDFLQGIAQASVQMESSLTRKGNHTEIQFLQKTLCATRSCKLDKSTRHFADPLWASQILNIATLLNIHFIWVGYMLAGGVNIDLFYGQWMNHLAVMYQFSQL